MYDKYNEKVEAEYQQQLDEAQREFEEEKALAVEEERDMDPKFAARITGLKRAKEARRKALEEVIQSDNEEELVEETEEEDFSEDD